MPEQICVFTTLRAPLPATLLFVNYHLNIGVDHMYLFFDDPQDAAIDLLAGNPQLTCIRCDAAYWAALTSSVRATLVAQEIQMLNSQVALDLARRRGYDWVIQIDSDELIYPESDLRSFLKAQPGSIDVVRFPVLEAVPDRLDYTNVFQDVAVFRAAPLSRPPAHLKYNGAGTWRYYADWGAYWVKSGLAGLLGGRLDFGKNYFRGHQVGKSAVRGRAAPLMFDAHFPIPPEGRALRATFSPRVRLLHYDSCGYQNWKIKWLRRYRLEFRVVKMSDRRQRQFQQFKEIYDSADENALIAYYEREYYLSGRQRNILSRLGLLERIRLDARLFDQHQ